jgi:hypothetical protein
MQLLETQKSDDLKGTQRMPEARYSYYRRCQVFRSQGEQCKAPAEKSSLICHAHAAQLATAVRRKRERRAVLAEAAAEMRKRGKPAGEIADLFTSFEGIQVTTAVMAHALIDGRIDCKTAGQMAVHLQTMSKLLRMIHRKAGKGRRRDQILPQICADERRLSKCAGEGEEPLRMVHCKGREGKQSVPLTSAEAIKIRRMDESLLALHCQIPHREEPRVFKLEVMALSKPSWAHGPPGLKAA